MNFEIQPESHLTSCGSEKSGRTCRVREQMIETTESSPLLRRITHGYWLRRRMYLIIFKHLINPDPHCWLTATNFINDIFPMGMQLMEINVTFSKKLNSRLKDKNFVIKN